MQIGLLGGGTMGELIVRGLLRRELVDPEAIVVVEVSEGRRRALRDLALGVQLAAEPAALAAVDVVLLCVKPQAATAALAPLRGRLPAGALAISIMAGIDIAQLQRALDHPAIVRSMPNLPARIGAGMTVWRAADEVSDLMRLVAKTIFQCLGREVRVDDEQLLDAATAVSGTGPAYLFYIAENLLEAALGFGFDERQALKLVRETFQGAMDLWTEWGESPTVLRQKVTSKGGTTEAAVEHFVAADIAGQFRAGVTRARDRARELAEAARRG